MAASAGPIDLSGAVWRKSAKSSPEGQNCVEVALNLQGFVAVRDSKHADGPTFALSRREWATFISSVKAGALTPRESALGSLPYQAPTRK
jgi:hypothetical protein